MDAQLKTLIDLQGVDTRIAAHEAEAARLPKEIAAIHAEIETAKKDVDAGKARLDATKKDQRTREKDLEVVQAKRSKRYEQSKGSFGPVSRRTQRIETKNRNTSSRTNVLGTLITRLQRPA